MENRSSPGFSLIELVIVLGLLSISSLAVASLASINSRSHQTAWSSYQIDSFASLLRLTLENPRTCGCIVRNNPARQLSIAPADLDRQILPISEISTWDETCSVPGVELARATQDPSPQRPVWVRSMELRQFQPLDETTYLAKLRLELGKPSVGKDLKPERIFGSAVAVRELWVGVQLAPVGGSPVLREMVGCASAAAPSASSGGIETLAPRDLIRVGNHDWTGAPFPAPWVPSTPLGQWREVPLQGLVPDTARFAYVQFLCHEMSFLVSGEGDPIPDPNANYPGPFPIKLQNLAGHYQGLRGCGALGDMVFNTRLVKLSPDKKMRVLAYNTPAVGTPSASSFAAVSLIGYSR